MDTNSQIIDTIIKNAIDALRDNDTLKVTRLARQIASIDPESEVSWLLLASVAKPNDSLAFTHEALLINPESVAAQEALVWAQGRLSSPPTEEILPDKDAAQTAVAEIRSSADILEPPPETLSIPGEHTIELEGAPKSLVEETDNFDEVFPPPCEISTEFEDLTKNTTDDGNSINGIYPPPNNATTKQEIPPEPPVGLLPRRDAESEHSNEDILSNHKKNAKKEWKFTDSAASHGHIQSPKLHSGLNDSHSSAMRRGERSVFSTLFIFTSTALAVVMIAALIGLIFLQPQLRSLWVDIFPSNGCQASLMIGTQTYQLGLIKPNDDKDFNIPSKQPGRAYYLDGTSSNFVFFLSPVSENLTLMNGLQTGEPALVTWSNCNTNTYRLSQPMQVVHDMPTLLSQNQTGITIIVPVQGSSSSFVLKGSPENILVPVTSFSDATLSTIAPDATRSVTSLLSSTPGNAELMAEIALQEIIPSEDLRTIDVIISIHNYGMLVGNLTVSDVSLTPDGSTPLAVFLTEPTLPLELAPGSTNILKLTFPHPSTLTATLRILTIEFNLEDY